MKEHNAFRAVGELDDDILALAEHSRSASYRSKKTRSVRTLVLKRILPIAACFCLLLSSVLVIGGMEPPEKPFDPDDYTTWQDRNNVVTAEQCEQIFLYATFEEVVGILGRPYFQTYFKPDHTRTEIWKRPYTRFSCSWMMEDGRVCSATFAPLRSNVTVEDLNIDRSNTLIVSDPPVYTAEWFENTDFTISNLENMPLTDIGDRERFETYVLPYFVVDPSNTILEDPLNDEEKNVLRESTSADQWYLVSAAINDKYGFADWLKKDIEEYEAWFFESKRRRIEAQEEN